MTSLKFYNFFLILITQFLFIIFPNINFNPNGVESNSIPNNKILLDSILKKNPLESREYKVIHNLKDKSDTITCQESIHNTKKKRKEKKVQV